MTAQPTGDNWILGLLAATGVAILLLGLRGFYVSGHLGWVDVAYCVVLLAPAAFLLLLTSYVLQHATLVAAMPVIVAMLMAWVYPSFAIALGLALIATVVWTHRRAR